MTEFTIQLSNRPGQLAGVAKMLADAGVNIEALAAFGVEDLGVVRVLVDDPPAAREVIREGGLVAEEREVITTIISHEPGTRTTVSWSGSAPCRSRQSSAPARSLPQIISLNRETTRVNRSPFASSIPSTILAIGASPRGSRATKWGRKRSRV